jgi:hypothetical protein
MSDTHSTDTTPQTEAPQDITKAIDNDAKAAQELSKPEDVSAYVEDRREQEKAEASAKEADPPQQRRASRYERLKRARDAAQAEAAELRKRLGTEPEQPSQDPAKRKLDPRGGIGLTACRFHCRENPLQRLSP